MRRGSPTDVARDSSWGSFGEIPIITPEPAPATVYRAPTSPEKALLAAVLEAAVADACSDDPTAIADAAEFFAADPMPGWPFSFRTICDTLHLDPGAVIEAIERRQRRLPPKIVEASKVVSLDDARWGRSLRQQRNRCHFCREMKICHHTRRQRLDNGRGMMVCQGCWPKLPPAMRAPRSTEATTARRMEMVLAALIALGGSATYGDLARHTAAKEEPLRLGLKAAMRRGHVVRARKGTYALAAQEVGA